MSLKGQNCRKKIKIKDNFNIKTNFHLLVIWHYRIQELSEGMMALFVSEIALTELLCVWLCDKFADHQNPSQNSCHTTSLIWFMLIYYIRKRRKLEVIARSFKDINSGIKVQFCTLNSHEEEKLIQIKTS